MVCIAYVARPVGRGRCIFGVRFMLCMGVKFLLVKKVGMGFVNLVGITMSWGVRMCVVFR